MSESPPKEKATPVGQTEGFKWLPVISDYCIGCGRCVKACPHECLGLTWDFAKLVNPVDCVSGGDCVEVCEHDGIEMQWLKTSAEPADREIGIWCEDPPPPAHPVARESLLKRLVGGVRQRLTRSGAR